MILMSGWMPNPDVTVAVMGITINTSGERARCPRCGLPCFPACVPLALPGSCALTLRTAGVRPTQLPSNYTHCCLACLAPTPAGIIWMWVSGYGMACSTRVSNSLGAGCPRVARRATWVAVAIALALVRARWGVRAAREDNCPAACCL